ncbi:alpha-ketoacid dehydrogenase subunit beta [Micrococcus terreus]|uniref:3-methyl-2-oxobutanoate dehydrogenase (2-methylpropanoyl-transferring) n=1 Tax=Micrococcus terreus TaxID=574650 RepID=A0A1I7MIN0_9MICC|nr:alpha-ketoacid dehydrogenase subunit beta [Micrococcus terreus]MDK7701041.1 alpha-ketoacid dehydrogenase subunit beta [Micrococcus terreus]WOO96799.1 alpha-ketoacid dehydrogenase subunit beta [Micrococcus terreus]SFV21756.1 pyruvate dehydrogenase E1 component beta subunit [Micrococcus terreus]
MSTSQIPDGGHVASSAQQPVPQTETLTIAKAITRALADELAADEKVLLMGEDIGSLGGVYRVTEGLKATFGADRVVDSPLAESGIIGTSIGLAMRGYRPVAEIQFDGFVFPGFNQITTQLAKMRARTQGTREVPVTIRIPYGGGIGSIEHHSESPEALFTHTPGLRVITPSNAHDAYWMTRQAIQCQDPVIVFEPKRRYWLRGEVDTSPAAGDAQPSPFRAVTVRQGSDATVVAWGPLVPVALAAAQAAEEDGRSLEVIDLRSLSPVDFDALQASVERTGRMVIAHEAPTFGGLGGEIAARLMERSFLHLEAPILRVGGFHLPYPPSRVEEHYLPDLDRILDAVDRLFTY